QLAAGDIDGMARTISDLGFTDVAYRRSLADLRRLWARAEADGRSMADGYGPLVADPATDPAGAWEVARLLTDAGHLAAGVRPHRFLVDNARRQGDALSSALVNLGSAQWLHGDLDQA